MKETWRLDRLILQGFKSFAERTVLDFPDPITGILGPNGSGKSNLVEALRFVTGARAHELRGQELKAFLFHGAEGKPPAGFAEVRLELSRGAERLTVERRIEGERSLFRVNGRPLSAKALALHLAGTGLGRGGYAIVGQGEVGALLEAPEEVLLGHLEEAAGLRPVAEAARAASERLEEATALLEAKEKALSELKARAQALEREARKAQRARELAGLALSLKRSLLLARKEEAEKEVALAEARLEALAQEEGDLLRRRQALEARREALAQEEEALRRRLEEVRLGLKEREALRAEARELQRVLQALDRPPPQDPGPPPPPPPLGREEAERRLKTLKEAEARLQAKRRRLEEAWRRYELELARHQERLLAHERAREERARLERELKEREEALKALEEAAERRRALEAQLREVQAQALALERERGRIEGLLASGADLQEGPRRARGLPGILGVVADLVRPEEGLELALEVALGPRLQWVLAEDEKAAQGAIAHLKARGGRATFLPLTLLDPPPPPRPREAEGLLGPAYRLARLRLPGLPEEAVLRVLLGDTLVFQDLEAALAYRKAGGRERLVTLEGEVLERTGALTGGRVKGGGEALRLRSRLEELSRELARLQEEARTLEEALKPLPRLQALEEARAQVKALWARLQTPLPPPPEPPSPPEAPREEEALERLKEERDALEEALALASAWERWNLLQEARRAWAEAQEEAKRVRARLAELEGRLRAFSPLEEEARALEARWEALRRERRETEERLAQALARWNALLAERENLRLTLARREALLEELSRELAQLPPTERHPGTPRALQGRLAQVEREREALGPVNALAEGELASLKPLLEAREKEVQEATEALLRLEAEVKAVEKAYAERLKESFHRFQEAFRAQAELLLGARAEARREGRGLRLFLVPRGKRTQDLRLLSLGEKTLGALAFLFALGELQGGLPIAVLDEVDAALDEANLLRFARFLQGGRQFLLVTHQKRTMEACHALYGVTAEGGVSRVYAIRKEVAHDA
ncbi:chromosome segregation protein [Thermus arciformis]|uniref:Chromosome segregation protein n=1 Tax=Thermus arciformis TaxID=482827 RepID=A0A1G7H8Q1_9DEIN|nr:chromosome segregation SMC family protein [Thermus arciformis]SDE96776.1 chromosome segregation protein [Thermus arciformis]